MKVAVISDLHSNREALEAVFAHIQAQAISTVYCLTAKVRPFTAA